MKTFNYIIKDKEGIHARPAGIIVAEAKKYASNITITNKGKSADLKRIFAVMGLCVKGGEEVIVSAIGMDEEDAINGLKAAFEKNL